MYENIYYSPEKFGMETVGEISWSEPCYDFDLTCVWKQARGKFFIASDSGCSCPSPFEDFTKVEDLEGPFTKAELRKHLLTMVAEYSGYGYSKDNLTGQVLDILSRI